MIVRRTLIGAAAAALLSVPVWALPGQAMSHPFAPPSTTPNNTDNPGASHRTDGANGHSNGNQSENASGDSGKGHNVPAAPNKCQPHAVAYVAYGLLEVPPAPTLSKNADGTYSGTLTVKVTRTNHHARGDRHTTKPYTVENVHVTLALADINQDGNVGIDDLMNGDRVKLIGKLTTLAKKCATGGFTPKTTIRRIVVHPPAS